MNPSPHAFLPANSSRNPCENVCWPRDGAHRPIHHITASPRDIIKNKIRLPYIPVTSCDQNIKSDENKNEKYSCCHGVSECAKLSAKRIVIRKPFDHWMPMCDETVSFPSVKYTVASGVASGSNQSNFTKPKAAQTRKVCVNNI